VTTLRLIGTGLLLLAGAVAYADPCKIPIESNDLMQFSANEITVPASCTEVEVTLRHSGKLPAKVMGHD
jgi:azurin